MNRLFSTLFLVVLLLSITNCSSTPVYAYLYCGHNSNQSDQLGLIFKDKIEFLKLSSTPEGFLVDSIRIQGGVQFFLSKIIYPEIAKRAGVEGINGASFTVDSLGNAIDIKLIKGIGAGCDEALLLAIKGQKFVYQSNFSEKFNEKVYLLVRFKLY
jgi:hypothetical protein